MHVYMYIDTSLQRYLLTWQTCKWNVIKFIALPFWGFRLHSYLFVLLVLLLAWELCLLIFHLFFLRKMAFTSQQVWFISYNILESFAWGLRSMKSFIKCNLSALFSSPPPVTWFQFDIYTSSYCQSSVDYRFFLVEWTWYSVRKNALQWQF